MLDTAIGPVTSVIDNITFRMNVTHIGRHNKFRYNSIETVLVASNNTGYTIIQLRWYGIRVSSHVRQRDIYNRLIADVYLEQSWIYNI
jgi:hypothetical protein